MSKATERDAQAAVFFALGDATRLRLVEQLSAGTAQSATALSTREAVSRQAIMKHLRVLADAGLVSTQKHGREVLYVLEPGVVDDARVFLDGISAGWDRAIARLKLLVEDPK